MSSASKIEWTEATWNPIVGCSILTPGCTNCYAMKMAARIERMGSAPHYAGLTKTVNGKAVWTGKLALAPTKTLLEPLRRTKPTTYFVNSMGDLFHEDIADEVIDRVFAVMALTPQHTYQVLTKRSARMRAYMNTPDRKRIIADAPVLDISDLMAVAAGSYKGRPSLDHFSACFEGHGPFPNVWLGVSAERQKEADERIPDLIETPAAVKFISAEPLLGPIEFKQVPGFNRVNLSLWNWWVIVGGESGPGARPMHPDWARSLRDQCQNARVSFFFKQWGAWQPFQPPMVYDESWQRHEDPAHVVAINGAVSTGDQLKGGPERGPLWCRIRNVGKKAAGRLLDGREWNEMPVTKERVAA